MPYSIMTLTSEIVSAFASHNHLPATELPDLIKSIFDALQKAEQPAPALTSGVSSEKPTAQAIRKSINREYLISFEDGQRYSMLKHHLRGRGMTMDDYRIKYNLPADYPSSAPAYSEKRSALAKAAGLGQQRRNSSATVEMLEVQAEIALPMDEAAKNESVAELGKPKKAAAKKSTRDAAKAEPKTVVPPPKPKSRKKVAAKDGVATAAGEGAEAA